MQFPVTGNPSSHPCPIPTTQSPHSSTVAEPPQTPAQSMYSHIEESCVFASGLKLHAFSSMHPITGSSVAISKASAVKHSEISTKAPLTSIWKFPDTPTV